RRLRTFGFNGKVPSGSWCCGVTQGDPVVLVSAPGRSYVTDARAAPDVTDAGRQDASIWAEWNKETGLRVLDIKRDNLLGWQSHGHAESPGASERVPSRPKKKMYNSQKGNNKTSACWTCNDCQPHQRVSDTGDACIDCSDGRGTMGILSTSFIIATFVRYNETPLVKASGRELSYCCSRDVSALLPDDFPKRKRPPFISPKSQLLIAGALISVQLACTFIWLVLSHPGTRIHHPQRLESILRCKIDDKSFFGVAVLQHDPHHGGFLRISTSPKFIGFTMYTTCIIWLAFVPLFFGTHSSFEPEKNVRKLTMNSNHYKKQASSSAGSYANHKGGSIEGDSNSTTLRTALPGQLYRSAEDSLNDDRSAVRDHRSSTLANPGRIRLSADG
uniref:G_PROTEIN_RECEP_F1_2 domain-containing protein n=1 Tax=Macrostomum lignano TaxID=282301 RepID=A0A1I8F461_9PLAT